MEPPGEGGQEPLLLMSSHLVSSTPAASHVFLSLLHERPFAVVTDAGTWIVIAGQINYSGPPADEECCDEVLADAGLPTKPPPQVPTDWSPEGENLGLVPHWQERLVAWNDTDDEDRPWRNDERLAGQFAKGYPDDLAVIFPPDPGDHRSEMMWVRIIDHHRESDSYLGVLLNQPHFLTTVRSWDNVVFGFDTEIGRPAARSRSGDYQVLAVAEDARDGGPLSDLYAGVLHFRRGESGQNEEEIAACIETLRPVVDSLPANANESDRYIAHYALGRCLAESYETDEAIQQFEKALDLRPGALDPNLALLAELSVKVHGQDPPGSEPWWDTAFIQHSEKVRQRFSAYTPVAVLFSSLFDPEVAEAAGPLPDSEVERRKKVGFAIFRWKQP